jgi:VanZ family protein
VLGDISQFIPGLLVAFAFGLVTGRAAASVLSAPRLLGIAMMAALGAILATTLSPSSGMPEVGSIPGTCAVSRLWPDSLSELLTINEVSLNVLMFIPLGLTLGLAPRSRRTIMAILAATALPFLIEAIQLLVPALGRYCDGADVADNLLGLYLGILLGIIASGAAGHRSSRSRPEIVVLPVEDR